MGKFRSICDEIRARICNCENKVTRVDLTEITKNDIVVIGGNISREDFEIIATEIMSICDPVAIVGASDIQIVRFNGQG